MGNDNDNERFYDFDSEDDDDIPTTEELAVWLSDFMSQSSKAEKMYRSHFCSIVVNRLWKEFGVEGMCELMLAIDKRAGWISDIILEDADLHDALFDNHGVFDDDAVIKARMSNRLMEMNKKIWRLRRKYSKLIAEEIVNGVETHESQDAPKP